MSLDPTGDASDLFERGHRHLGDGDLGEALECFTRAVTLRPDVAAGYRARAAALAGLNRRTEAVADLDRAVRLKPDDPALYAERAELLFRQKAYDRAIADCEKVLALDAGWAPVYGLRGECHAAVGESDKALADFAAAAEGDPEHAAEYLLARANLRLDLAHHREAVEDCEAVLRLAPDTAAAFRTRGLALQGLGDLLGAEADLSRAQALAPDATLTLLLRAMVRRDLGRFAEAVEDCDAVIRAGESLWNAHVLRGGCRVELLDYQGAVDDFTEALRLNPNPPLPRLSRADAFERQGKVAEGVRDYLDVLKRSPREAFAWNRLAWVWATTADEGLRDGERAKEFATRACELTDWADPRCLDTLAAALAACGEFDDAAAWEEKAIGLAGGTDAEAFEGRLALYRDRRPLVIG